MYVMALTRRCSLEELVTAWCMRLGDLFSMWDCNKSRVEGGCLVVVVASAPRLRWRPVWLDRLNMSTCLAVRWSLELCICVWSWNFVCFMVCLLTYTHTHTHTHINTVPLSKGMGVWCVRSLSLTHRSSFGEGNGWRSWVQRVILQTMVNNTLSE